MQALDLQLLLVGLGTFVLFLWLLGVLDDGALDRRR
jgi:hypothetical protein